MKEKLKYIIIGILLVVAAFFIPNLMDGYLYMLFGFIPLNGTVVAVVAGIFGVLCILLGIMEKKKDDNQDQNQE